MSLRSTARRGSQAASCLHSRAGSCMPSSYPPCWAAGCPAGPAPSVPTWRELGAQQAPRPACPSERAGCPAGPRPACPPGDSTPGTCSTPAVLISRCRQGTRSATRAAAACGRAGGGASRCTGGAQPGSAAAPPQCCREKNSCAAPLCCRVGCPQLSRRRPQDAGDRRAALVGPAAVRWPAAGCGTSLRHAGTLAASGAEWPSPDQALGCTLGPMHIEPLPLQQGRCLFNTTNQARKTFSQSSRTNFLASRAVALAPIPPGCN